MVKNPSPRREIAATPQPSIAPGQPKTPSRLLLLLWGWTKRRATTVLLLMSLAANIYQLSGGPPWPVDPEIHAHDTVGDTSAKVLPFMITNKSSLDTGAAHTDGIGTVVVGPNVRAVAWSVDLGGTLNVEVVVKNLAFVKQVAIVYTLNGWLTFSNAFGSFQRSFPPPTLPHQIQSELWQISVPVTAGSSRKFAVFYTVGGFTYWDNNFGLDYSF